MVFLAQTAGSHPSTEQAISGRYPEIMAPTKEVISASRAPPMIKNRYRLCGMIVSAMAPKFIEEILA